MQRRNLLNAAMGALVVAMTGVSSRSIGSATASAAPVPDRFSTLRSRLSGRVLLPGDKPFDALSHIYAAKVQERPAAIIHVESDHDVALAIGFARESALPLSVRSGGHSYAGFSLCDGGVMIDLSGLQTVRLNEEGTVSVGGGALVGQIDAVTTAVNRAAVLGQCPGVGIGGLTTGGGVGYLMGAHGLAIDNLVSARVVLANGSIVETSATKMPDLFWAIRGGGGNFGIVTEFTFKTHPVSTVLAGNLILRFDDVVGVLEAFDAFVATIPDGLTLIAVAAPGPGGKPILVVQACWLGDVAEGQRVLAPLRASSFVMADEIKVQPYLSLQSSVPAHVPPSRHENRTGFFPRITPEIAGIFAELLTGARGGYMLSFIHLHGAATAPAANATAFPMRTKGFAWGVTGFWSEPAQKPGVIDWTVGAWERLSPMGQTAYVNTMDVEDQSHVRAAYGDNYDRLARLKRTYDPQNLFRRNQNILPA